MTFGRQKGCRGIAVNLNHDEYGNGDHTYSILEGLSQNYLLRAG